MKNKLFQVNSNWVDDKKRLCIVMRTQSREWGENPKNLWQEITCKCKMDAENTRDETGTPMKWGGMWRKQHQPNGHYNASILLLLLCHFFPSCHLTFACMIANHSKSTPPALLSFFMDQVHISYKFNTRQKIATHQLVYELRQFHDTNLMQMLSRESYKEPTI